MPFPAGFSTTLNPRPQAAPSFWSVDGNPVPYKGQDASQVVGAASTFISAVSMTQAAYDALAVKDPTILYVIV